MLSGVYFSKLSRGRAFLPQMRGLEGTEAFWFLVSDTRREGTEELRILLKGGEEAPDGPYVKIVASGACKISPKRLWTLPAAVQKALGTEDCVWVGCGFFAELMSASAFHERLERELDGDPREYLKKFGL